MHIRLFVSRVEDSENVSGIVRALRAVRLHQRGGAKSAAWDIEICDGLTWCASERLVPADVHIHYRVPVRVAMPWACANVVVADPASWKILVWDWVFLAGGADLVIYETAPAEAEPLQPEGATVRGWTLPEDGHRVFWERVLARPRAAEASLPRSLNVPKGTMPPKVGIVTVTRNRTRWWPNMLQNVTKQTWPVSRLEWIVVDDGDAGERLEERVREFQEKVPGLVVRYVPLAERTPIGTKRNLGCAAAGEDVSVFMMMDDDDHYPADSVAVRASWLTCAGTQIVSCATLPMYDITRYISAMNVPPLEQLPSERVSEATLAFTREAWTACAFPPVSIAEGDEFVAGREPVYVEIPPAGVIVSFIHSANTSSRRVPKDQPANGSHYGFSDEYFRYLHGTAGEGTA
jgi:hypothetical protein